MGTVLHRQEEEGGKVGRERGQKITYCGWKLYGWQLNFLQANVCELRWVEKHSGGHGVCSETWLLGFLVLHTQVVLSLFFTGWFHLAVRISLLPPLSLSLFFAPPFCSFRKVSESVKWSDSHVPHKKKCQFNAWTTFFGRRFTKSGWMLGDERFVISSSGHSLRCYVFFQLTPV